MRKGRRKADFFYADVEDPIRRLALRVIEDAYERAQGGDAESAAWLASLDGYIFLAGVVGDALGYRSRLLDGLKFQKELKMSDQNDNLLDEIIDELPVEDSEALLKEFSQQRQALYAEFRKKVDERRKAPTMEAYQRELSKIDQGNIKAIVDLKRRYRKLGLDVY